MTNFLLVMHHSRIYFVLKVDDYFSACDALFQIMLSQDRRHGVKVCPMTWIKRYVMQGSVPGQLLGIISSFLLACEHLEIDWLQVYHFTPYCDISRKILDQPEGGSSTGRSFTSQSKQTEDKSKQSAWFYCTCIEYSGQAKLIIFSKCPNLIGEFVKFFS